MTITEKLTYRLFEDRDLPGILLLWEAYSGWGAITEEQFKQWHFTTPCGPCLIIVAVDEEDQVLGQIVFTPSRFQLHGRQVKAVRSAAPILHDRLKAGKITDYDHPTFVMFRLGMEEAKRQGYSLLYLFPALGWTAVLKRFPKYGLPLINVASFDCFSIPLDAAATYSGDQQHCYASLLKGGFSQEHDHLWADAITQFPIECGVERSANWLNWKLASHLVFEIRENRTEHLKGYVAVKKDSGLIVDALAKSKNDLKSSIAAVVRTLHHLNPERIAVPLSNLNGMYTPMFQSMYPDAAKLNFRFGFGCYPLEETINQQYVAPSSWYMMPND